MSSTKDDPRLLRLAQREAAKPVNGKADIYINHWWIVDPDTKDLIFWSPTGRYNVWMYPQCNQNKDVAQLVRDRLYPWAEIMHVPTVYRRAIDR